MNYLFFTSCTRVCKEHELWYEPSDGYLLCILLFKSCRIFCTALTVMQWIYAIKCHWLQILLGINTQCISVVKWWKNRTRCEQTTKRYRAEISTFHRDIHWHGTIPPENNISFIRKKFATFDWHTYKQYNTWRNAKFCTSKLT